MEGRRNLRHKSLSVKSGGSLHSLKPSRGALSEFGKRSILRIGAPIGLAPAAARFDFSPSADARESSAQGIAAHFFAQDPNGTQPAEIHVFGLDSKGFGYPVRAYAVVPTETKELSLLFRQLFDVL